MPNQHCGRGFTLPELVTSIAILAILVSVAAPSFTNLRLTTLADGTKNDFYALFNFARMSAIDRQSVVAVCPLTASGICSNNWTNEISVFEDINGNHEADSDEVILRTLEPGIDGWGTQKLPASRAYFEWNAIGTSNGTAGSVVICKPGGIKSGRALVVSFAGRVRTSHDYDGDGVHERIPGTPIDCS
mgnify:CR=1 FL=1